MSSTRYTRLLCSAAVIALASGTAAWADDANFNIQPQSLNTALNAFSEQSAHPVLFKSDMALEKLSPGVSGQADPEIALAQLLQGTGLSYRRAGDTFVIVEGGSSDPQSGSAAGDGADGTVEALIVTAQKREEDIQDVPIAISAFTQEDLTRSQVAGGPDLMTQVPNFTFTKTNFSSYSIQIRGIGTQAISATTDAAVAVAFNNTPFIRNRFFEQEFYDLQRVEVLRGPQGTLYGRNATAGVVNIISAKPTFNFEAKLSGDVSNYNSTRLEGMVNIPLVEDAAAVRLAAAWTKRDGYATNQLTGNPIDGRDLWSTRVSLRVAPTDALDINLIWEHFEENDDRLRSGKQLCDKDVVTDVGGVPVERNQLLPMPGLRYDFNGTQGTFSQGCERNSLYSPDVFQTPNGEMLPYYLPLGALGLPTFHGDGFWDPYASDFQSPDLRVIESTVDPDYRAKADLGELQINWDITDNLTLTSETAYSADFVWSLQDFNRFNTRPGAWETEYGGGPNQAVIKGILKPNGEFCDPQLGCSDRLIAVDLARSESRQFSQEFRLGSDFEGPFNFSLGANFLRFDGIDKYYVFFNSLTLASLNGAIAYTPYSYVQGVTDNHQCAQDAVLSGDVNGFTGYGCIFVENNSIENIQDQGHNYFLSLNPYKLISYAVFGEAYYNVTDALKITAGMRWTVDKKEAPRIPSWTFAGNTRGYPVMEVIEQEWREPTGRLTVDWKPDLAFTDETLLYASYAHGYKAGGANPPPMMSPNLGGGDGNPREWNSLTRPATFDPEFVDAFELGSKSTLADGKVTLNMAAFYYDYEGYQISEIVDRSAFNRNFDAEVWGVELEADWRPLENLRLGFKGGYEKTRIADGEEAIDLMDRTAGNEDWLVIRPFPTFASSCILPVYVYTSPEATDYGGALFHGVGEIGSGQYLGCEMAYLAGLDPVTNLPYEPYPTVGGSNSALYFYQPGDYPGFNPLDESVFKHNHGEGFTKQLGGNELPNAPNWTATITADYTVPLPNDWLASLHTDVHWQSESWWRVFNDHDFNKLDDFYFINLAAIFTNEDAGWKIMAYVKNVLDEDALTGAFLNSDDTGLTTNVFLIEPRLYGLRVTKEWTGGPLFGGFGGRHEGPYPFEVEIGGQVQRHDAPNDSVAPSFADLYSDALDPTQDQDNDLDWGDGRDVRVSWRPNDAWKVSLGARYGRTNGSTPWESRSEFGDKFCNQKYGSPYYYYAPPLCSETPEYYQQFSNYSVTKTSEREQHTLVDFMVGKDVGIGGLSHSSISAGLRYAELKSSTDVHVVGVPNWNIDPDVVGKYVSGTSTRDRFDAQLSAGREFKGVGPILTWDASHALLGNNDVGVVGLDWSLSGGVLFGKRKTLIEGQEIDEYYYTSLGGSKYGGNPRPRVPTSTTTTEVHIPRSESATVPTYGASVGLSYRIDRLSVGAGYRWERYQDAIDGGMDEAVEEDRTIDGPYFKLSVGFGGG